MVDLARRMAWAPMRGSAFPARFPARLVAGTRDGRRLVAEVETVEGAPERPVAADRVLAKFRDNAGRRLDDAGASALEAAVLRDRSARAVAEALRR